MKYYIENKPVQKELEDKYKYIFIAKNVPQQGFTKAEIKKIKEERKIMFKMLDSGIYDIGNGIIEAMDVSHSTNLYHVLKNLCFIYKIKPVNVKMHNGHPYISKFIVENRFDNIYDFIDDLNIECANLVFGCLFNINIDNMKVKVMELFKYYHRKFPERKINISSCVTSNYSIYGYEDDMMTLIKNNEIYLDENNKREVINKLLINNWFNVLIEYIKFNNITKEDIINVNVLIENANNKIVKQIMNLLDIDDTSISINIYDEDSCVKTISFKDINEARTYVIRNYGVTFENSCKDVCDWCGSNGFLSHYSFKIKGGC